MENEAVEIKTPDIIWDLFDKKPCVPTCTVKDREKTNFRFLLFLPFCILVAARKKTEFLLELRKKSSPAAFEVEE